MKIRNPFAALSAFEWGLWLFSLTAILVSAFVAGKPDVWNLAASLLGVTSLIFLSKGDCVGQFVMIAFSLVYAFTAYRNRYYGEMLIYLCMQIPVGIVTIVSWLRHPHKAAGAEVRMRDVTIGQALIVLALTAAVTVGFFFLLRACGTANLPVGTVSVATSFFALSFLVLRSPYYAAAFLCNDVVLIVLWSCALASDLACLPMVVCFSVFFLNDCYSFFNWMRIRRRQKRERAEE